MANIYEGAVEVSRRTMTLFFIVDASGSMDGAKMGTLNSAIEEVIPEIPSHKNRRAGIFKRHKMDYACSNGRGGLHLELSHCRRIDRLRRGLQTA